MLRNSATAIVFQPPVKKQCKHSGKSPPWLCALLGQSKVWFAIDAEVEVYTRPFSMSCYKCPGIPVQSLTEWHSSNSTEVSDHRWLSLCLGLHCSSLCKNVQVSGRICKVLCQLFSYYRVILSLRHNAAVRLLVKFWQIPGNLGVISEDRVWRRTSTGTWHHSRTSFSLRFYGIP